MCGIAGYCTYQPTVSNKEIISMVRLLAHRGPDDEGFTLINTSTSSQMNFSGNQSHTHIRNHLHSIEQDFNFPHTIALGHRRYSIIDLSPDGHQPMVRNENVLIFNGEIYNYIEIRKELETKHNRSFQTRTDSETILAAYEIWGTDCFSKLNGFFSIVIFNRAENKLIFARDRIGKAPLYYHVGHNGIYFASEIKSILAVCPHLRGKTNQDAISEYLLYGIRDYEDKTFWTSINTFPAASHCTVDLLNTNSTELLEIKKYWDFPNKRLGMQELSFEDATKELMQRLTNALAIRLRSDVPVGFTLSGGLDSSTLAALYVKNFSAPANFLSVKYDNPKLDESGYASKVASINPSIINLDFIDGMKNHLMDDIDHFTNLIEEPYHSPVLYTDYYLQKLLKQRGYGVMINGAAGDELLAGYEAEYFPSFIRHIRATSLSSAIHQLLSVKSRRMARCSLKTALSLIGINIPGKKIPSFMLTTYPDNIKNPHDFNALMLANFSSRKMNYWMRSGNKSYMGVPIEPRMPFLDYNVVEWAFTLPPQYLINNGWHKYILRKGIEKQLPKEVVWRKVKMGFPFDLTLWLNQHKQLLTNNLKDVNQKTIDTNKLFAEYDKLAQVHPTVLWRYISFLLWQKRVVFNESIIAN
jgi:asparagine synthase (glutamine-hydrolysing)